MPDKFLRDELDSGANRRVCEAVDDVEDLLPELNRDEWAWPPCADIAKNADRAKRNVGPHETRYGRPERLDFWVHLLRSSHGGVVNPCNHCVDLDPR